MKLGILETGAPPQALEPAFGDYPDMFRALLGPGLDYQTFDVAEGVLPDRPEACDAYLITGSAAGVYDPRAWIAPLTAFLRAAKGKAPLVGVCFGHQLMAETFGGRVVKSPKGWGVGLHSYRLHAHEPWMDPIPTIAAPASHQDQVVEVPPEARVIGGSAFTPYAVLAYADQPAISFQFHPEFDPAYAAALIESRRGSRFGEKEADAALESLRRPNDRQRVGAWIRRFLETGRSSACP